MSYSNQEDRLVMGISSKNSEEMQLFLTRRISSSFWDILRQTIEYCGADNKQKQADFKQKSTAGELSIKPNSAVPIENKDKFPLTKTPILVEKININIDKNNNIGLAFINAQSEVNLNINPQLLQNISDLLTKIMPITGWNIAPPSNSELFVTKQANGETLH